MKCWLLWHGGASYAPGSVADDVEQFDTLRELKRSFDRRADSWETYYPCVEREPQDEGGQSGWVFFYDPNDPDNGPGDAYPDRIICYGPRGGLRLEYA